MSKEFAASLCRQSCEDGGQQTKPLSKSSPRVKSFPLCRPFHSVLFGDSFTKKSQGAADSCHTDDLLGPTHSAVCCGVDWSPLVATSVWLTCCSSSCLHLCTPDSFGGQCQLESPRLLISLSFGLLENVTAIIQLIFESPDCVRGWQCIINTIYQNSEKLPEFINVLIIFGICIMSLPALLLSSFPGEVVWRKLVGFLQGLGEERGYGEAKRRHKRDTQSAKLHASGPDSGVAVRTVVC